MMLFLFNVELEDGTVIYHKLPTLHDARILAVEYSVEHETTTVVRNRFGFVRAKYEGRMRLEGDGGHCIRVK